MLEKGGQSPSVNQCLIHFVSVSPHQVTSLVSLASLVTAVSGPQPVSGPRLFTMSPRDIVTCDAECHEDFGLM